MLFPRARVRPLAQRHEARHLVAHKDDLERREPERDVVAGALLELEGVELDAQVLVVLAVLGLEGGELVLEFGGGGGIRAGG